MFSKQFITISHLKDLFFHVHSENQKRSPILSDAVAEMQWLIPWNNKSGAWSKHGGVKFGPFLINMVAQITELWVENSHKINFCDVTSIQERRMYLHLQLFVYLEVLLPGPILDIHWVQLSHPIYCSEFWKNIFVRNS